MIKIKTQALKLLIKSIVLGLVVILLADYGVLGALKQRALNLDEKYLSSTLRIIWHGPLLLLHKSVDSFYTRDYTWLNKGGFIPFAHALGPTLFSGANTLATFEEAYKRGFRFFEVDLAMTKDDYLVCEHGDEHLDKHPFTLEEYKAQRVQSGLLPCFFSDLVKKAQEKKNIYFILDVKNRYNDVYKMVRSQVGNTGVGHQFIPQVYQPAQIEIANPDGFFSGEIFTSYVTPLPTKEILRIARQSGIRAVTLTLARAQNLDKLEDGNVYIFTHPVDDPFVAMKLKRKGFKGIYSGYLSPAWFPEIFSDSDRDMIAFPR